MQGATVTDISAMIPQQVMLGLVLVYLQNWLKQQKWFPVISYETTKANERLNHLFAVVTSGVATVGIHMAYSGGLAAGGTLTVTLPALPVLAHGTWHWLCQYIISKTSYSALKGQLNPLPSQQSTAVTVVPPSDADIKAAVADNIAKAPSAGIKIV